MIQCIALGYQKAGGGDRPLLPRHTTNLQPLTATSCSDDVLQHRRAIGITRGFRLDGVEHANFLEQPIKVESGRRGVVDHRIRGEQRRFQLIDGCNRWRCGTRAHEDVYDRRHHVLIGRTR